MDKRKDDVDAELNRIYRKEEAAFMRCDRDYPCHTCPDCVEGIDYYNRWNRLYTLAIEERIIIC